MKNTTMLGIAIVILLVGGIYVFSGNSSNVKANVVVDSGSGEVQKVVIGMKDYNYYPQEIRVNANQPVSISLDESVYGCFRAFTIRELGLSKNLRTSTDTLDFTPTQKGTYTFACSMGMGTGKLIVE